MTSRKVRPDVFSRLTSAKEAVMFFPTAQVDRLIVSASVALVVMLSTATASGQTSGFTPLIASHSGKCLDVSGGSAADGAFHHSVAVSWRREPAVASRGRCADGYSRIVSRHSGKCLDVSGEIGSRWRFHHSVAVSWRREPELAPRSASPARSPHWFRAALGDGDRRERWVHRRCHDSDSVGGGCRRSHPPKHTLQRVGG